MALEMNLIEIRAYKGKERLSKIKEYRVYKESLIQEYMKIQDILDDYNDKVNTICCEIEKVNIILNEIDKEK